MLVRKLPVKLAVETRQMGLNRAAWMQAESQSVCLRACISVCLVSIHQSTHNVCVNV